MGWKMKPKSRPVTEAEMAQCRWCSAYPSGTLHCLMTCTKPVDPDVPGHLLLQYEIEEENGTPELDAPSC